jgi:membrane-bound lytic murein transglycosylase D
MVLPVPELPLDIALNSSADLAAAEAVLASDMFPISVMIFPEEDIEFEKEPAPMLPPGKSSRPLRTTPYLQPIHLLSHVRVETQPPPVWEERIPGLDQPLTQEYIHRYSSPEGLELLNAIMRRGAPYLAFIKKEVEARNLPQELMYLPVIESAYIPTAVSKSGATGLWQFMKNSIAPYDMKVTEWMDERMDFWKSTTGALSKLEENYRQLGDWALALAAYNAGLGGVTRIIQQTKINDYWILSERKAFKVETIHYVPKLLAIFHILSNPRRFGIDPLWPEDLEWTRVKVGRTVDLELLAQEVGIDTGELKKLNGELLYNVTPPDSNYYLKVRAAYAPAITAVLEQKDIPLIRYYFHTITSGDTLSALAKQYGVSVDHITNANPGIKERYLKIGSRILIPAYKDVAAAPKPKNTSANANTTATTHLVKRGETLWSIAKLYKIAPEALASANGMELNDILREGRYLKLR